MLGYKDAPHRDFARFAALSGGGWLLDTALLLALVALFQIPASVANLFSAATAASLVYLVSHHRIHDGQRHRTEIRLGIYLIYTAALILAASLAIGAILPLLGAGTAATFAAKCIVTPPQLLCNFLVSRTLARATLGRRNG
ncbi:hypothetical protein P1X14_19165 [Sphingomonas sp. AOB5]|uniref:GtrA family protein n=1 Tax=Sphingomonas sp. AOB5 TaxID=3034017 RepID=UPI0023F922B1|nr:GtrA family protein [Sphingomonas sp. AOB5]MDF7777386.1 hypothetical protein [Sphingomonas sp. AOB5]